MGIREYIEPSAAQRVVATPELLSIILSYLSPATIILSGKYVSRIWHAIITHPDKDLQTALFLRHASPGSIHNGEIIYNDLLPCIFKTNFDQRERGIREEQLQLHELPWKRSPEAWARNEHIWRDMQVAQPPSTKLAMSKDTLSSRAFPRSSGMSGSIECPEGVTFGLLYDIIQDWENAARDPECEGRVRKWQLGAEAWKERGFEWDEKMVRFWCWDERVCRVGLSLAGVRMRSES